MIMANKDDPSGSRSVSDLAETAEPTSNEGNIPAAKKDSGAQRSQTSQSALTSAVTPVLRKSSSSNSAPMVSSPLAQSPRTSRNTSPIRKDVPPTLSSILSTQPSAAAIQRALSASNVPQSQNQSSNAASEGVQKTSRGNSKSASGSGDNTPSWPVSPRLRSPPPSAVNSRRASAIIPKRNDAPNVLVLSATPQNKSPLLQATKQTTGDNPKSELPLLQPPAPPKSSTRGASGKSTTLETVQENSSDSQEPSPAAIQAAADLKPLTKILDDETTSSKRDPPKTNEQKQTQLGESGSESAGNKSDTNQRGRKDSASQGANNKQAPRPRNASQNTFTSSATKSRPGDGKQNMTVETETVQSIPQSGLAPASESANRLRSDNGSVKLKPSNETIRPKKERKKPERKTRSVNQGSATSKADLFEARVANYVEEANTSDSDETFVYESNPPEPQRHPRHHSRTPSVKSSHSIADQQRGTMRNYGESHEGPRVGGKRSMKFSSNPYNDVDSPESKDGAVRAHTPRHIGRFGRGGNHSLTHDQQDSPFTQASRVRQNHLQHSRPNSPKSQQNTSLRGGLFSGNRKQEQPYDFDAEQNADDEQTPLMGTVRGPRVRGARRIGSSNAQSLHEYPEERRGSKCFRGRTGSCVLTMLVVLLVVISAVGFVAASNRSLHDVEIRKVKNVLASEEELFLDLVVSAINPNALAVTISDMDLDIFAKSKHVGAVRPPPRRSRSRRSETRRQRRGDSNKAATHDHERTRNLSSHWHAPDTRPDADKETQTMLLGRIFHFDQVLTFDASPIKQHEHFASGQVRLMKPGNETEAGGSAHWERLIQNDFELVVRGVLKYQLPISARQQRAAVGASVIVHPQDGIDQNGNMRTDPIDHSEHWQWIDWPDVMEDDPTERGVD